MKYRTKIREVDAVQWTGDNAEKVFRFLWPNAEYVKDGPNRTEHSDFIRAGVFFCAGGGCPPGGFITRRSDGAYEVVAGGAFLEVYEAAE